MSFKGSDFVGVRSGRIVEYWVSSDGLHLPARIDAALRDDPRRQYDVFEVVEQPGAVTLMGQVRHSETARTAEEITVQQQGMRSVYNNLRIRS